MKKIIASIFVLALFIAPLAFVGTVENSYKLKDTEIVSIQNNVITFEDSRGELWDYEIENTKDYKIGMKADLTMFTNYTEKNIYDDEIVKIKIK